MFVFFLVERLEILECMSGFVGCTSKFSHGNAQCPMCGCDRCTSKFCPAGMLISNVCVPGKLQFRSSHLWMGTHTSSTAGWDLYDKFSLVMLIARNKIPQLAGEFSYVQRGEIKGAHPKPYYIFFRIPTKRLGLSKTSTCEETKLTPCEVMETQHGRRYNLTFEVMTTLICNARKGKARFEAWAFQWELLLLTTEVRSHSHPKSYLFTIHEGCNKIK